jgi:hypothetical protein
VRVGQCCVEPARQQTRCAAKRRKATWKPYPAGPTRRRRANADAAAGRGRVGRQPWWSGAERSRESLPAARSAAAREGHQPRGGPSRSRSARLQSSGPVCRHARLELSPPAARDARRPAVPAPGTSPCLSPAVVLSRDSAGFPCAAVAVAVAPTTTGN